MQIHAHTCSSFLCSPELAAPAHAVVQAVHGVQHSVRAVVRVSVGDVEAEALLAPPLVGHEPVPLVVGQAVLFFQAAQRQDSVDWLEDDGSDHLRARDGVRRGSEPAPVSQAFQRRLLFFFSILRWNLVQQVDCFHKCVSFSYAFDKDSSFGKGRPTLTGDWTNPAVQNTLPCTPPIQQEVCLNKLTRQNKSKPTCETGFLLPT